MCEKGTWLFVTAVSVYLLCCSDTVCCLETRTTRDGVTGAQTQYEWVQGQEVYQYAQDFSFSLLAFTVPLRAFRADFHLTLSGGDTKPRNKTAVVSLRRSSIPVVQLYNETFPDQYVLPGDQQFQYVHTDQRTYTITLNSPTPGRVYLVATVLNHVDDVTQALQWGEKLKGTYSMDVSAVYTILPEVTSLDTDHATRVTVVAGQKRVMSFRVPAFTGGYNVSLTDCRTPLANSCPILVTISDSLSADDASSHHVNCSNQGQQCTMWLESPLLEKESYVTFSFDDVSGASNVSFEVMFKMTGCKTGLRRYTIQSTADNVTAVEDYTPALYRSLVGLSAYSSEDQDPACLNQGLLGRLSLPSSSDFAFSTEFALWTIEGDVVPEIDVFVPDFTTEVRTFVLQDMVDSGGVLAIKVSLMSKSWRGAIRICAMAQRVDVSDTMDQCRHGSLLLLNLTSGSEDARVTDVAYLPFPVAATWYLSMRSQCDSGLRPCEVVPMVRLEVSVTQCVPGACGQYGTCNLYMEATTVFAACECWAGYRGLTCNDTDLALTVAQQLQAVYLLTLSNLAFLPAIALAVYRRHYPLAAIFFFNFFFSTFYHACDASKVFRLCITDYDALQFCDFFGSVLSFWALLLTMARIPDELRTFFLLSGAMVIALFEDDDRRNNLALIAPIVVAGVILIVSWAVEMRRRRRLFPSKKRYLVFLLPGAVLALSGILVKFLVQSLAQYQYGHSYWHLAVMIAPCFLMPPRRRTDVRMKPLSLSASKPDDHVPTNPQAELGQEDQPAMFDASMNSINTERQPLVM